MIALTVMIASTEDSSQMGQQALADIDSTWRQGWNERGAFRAGTHFESPENSINDLIADQISKKISRAQFVQNIKTFRNQGNFSHSYPQEKKPEKKWTDQNSSGSQKDWNENGWRRNSSPDWTKNVPKAGGKGSKNYQNFQNKVNNNKGGNKRPTSVDSSPQPNKKQNTRAPANKGIICQWHKNNECSYGKKCLYAHTFEEVFEYQQNNQ